MADEEGRVETSTDETAAAITVSAAIDASVREPDGAKATRDQGRVYATSASRDHLAETGTTMGPARPSEDPGDTTGNDERHPDEPTEPSDKPEGTGREMANRGSRASRRSGRRFRECRRKAQRPRATKATTNVDRRYPLNRQTATTQYARQEVAQTRRPSQTAARTCERSQRVTTTYLQELDARWSMG